MKKINCLVSYRGFTNVTLPKFITLIEGGLYANPQIFVTPPVPLDEFKVVELNYINAVSKYDVAPKIEKTNMLIAKEKMIGVLDNLRVYVNGVANGNADIITLSGFTPSKAAAQKSKPLDRYGDFDLKLGDNSGELKAKITAYPLDKNVKYMMLCTKQDQLPENFIVNGVFDFSVVPDAKFALNNGRIKLFTNLEAGTVYYFYLFISNTVSISPPSLPKSFKM